MNRRYSLVSLLAIGAALGLASESFAQCTPPITTIGPDVVVGDLTGPSNYASDGTYDAFSMGTYSCNIGNNWLNWFQNTNQHPVIGQNLYKMKTQADGTTRFEQIGQSWLKHGFFALSNTLCCSGCSATDGTHLGVHCSDPYSSSRNGDQGAPLGPKYQVNAATGYFIYPPAGGTGFSTSTDRRCAGRLTDLETSSATIRYFGSGIYICSAHTPSGGTDGQEPDANRDNNESYRQLSYSGGNFGFVGNTLRGLAGIYAWSSNEAGVTNKTLTVSPDQDGLDGSASSTTNHGTFILAAKAYNLGGGQWHYEYAVQNLNSHRSGQSFSIPVPASVTLTNIGFHDVEYRNGDGVGNTNRSGTDWTATNAGGALTWATQTYAQNSNANALRWDTLYNLRFDANSAPVAGGATATITLYRPVVLPTDPTSVSATGIPAPSAVSFPIGDINHDGHVDLSDLALLLSHFGLCLGDPGYDDLEDLVDNNCIDVDDLATLLAHFGA